MKPDPIDYPRVLFTESQRLGGRAKWIFTLVTSLIPVGLLCLMLIFVIRGGRAAQPLVLLLGIGVASLVPMVAVSFTRLTTTVTTSQTVLHFAFYRRRIPHTQVSGFEPMKYHWTDFGGWGMKWDGDKTWAFTMRGDRAVRLRLVNGKRVVIGSQRADELATALEEAGIARMPERTFTPLA